jgi:hypothetical protein
MRSATPQLAVPLSDSSIERREFITLRDVVIERRHRLGSSTIFRYGKVAGEYAWAGRFLGTSSCGSDLRNLEIS